MCKSFIGEGCQRDMLLNTLISIIFTLYSLKGFSISFIFATKGIMQRIFSVQRRELKDFSHTFSREQIFSWECLFFFSLFFLKLKIIMEQGAHA